MINNYSRLSFQHNFEEFCRGPFEVCKTSHIKTIKLFLDCFGNFLEIFLLQIYTTSDLIGRIRYD